jgi:hypothetical protein
MKLATKCEILTSTLLIILFSVSFVQLSLKAEKNILEKIPCLGHDLDRLCTDGSLWCFDAQKLGLLKGFLKLVRNVIAVGKYF